jgi:hypothetical protein
MLSYHFAQSKASDYAELVGLFKYVMETLQIEGEEELSYNNKELDYIPSNNIFHIRSLKGYGYFSIYYDKIIIESKNRCVFSYAPMNEHEELKKLGAEEFAGNHTYTISAETYIKNKKEIHALLNKINDSRQLDELRVKLVETQESLDYYQNEIAKIKV